MTEEQNFSQRLIALQQRIANAAVSCGRDPSEIKLIAVSKGHPVESIRLAYQLGLRDFGESYVQEWSLKKQQLADLPDLRWHFIGHLQSNKVKFLGDSIYCIHSIDRQSVLEVLERRFTLLSQGNDVVRIKALLQLSVDPTDIKKRAAKSFDLHGLCEIFAGLQHIEWEGFMGIGPANIPADDLHACYENFSATAWRLWKQYQPDAQRKDPVFSLGMSNDLEIAIATGSTMVRIGTALFGERPLK